jgi:hypothetical protein
MSASVRWNGLSELRAELRRLPADLAGEAGGIVLAHAMGAGEQVKGEYERHRRSGALANGVSVRTQDKGQYGAGAVVRSGARHAWLFENGSQARHTAIGANRGSMPPAHVFIPAMRQWRRRMYEALADMLERRGLAVRGNVAA